MSVCGLMLTSQMSYKVFAFSELSTTFPIMEGSSSFDYIKLVLNSEMAVEETLSFEHFSTSLTG